MDTSLFATQTTGSQKAPLSGNSPLLSNGIGNVSAIGVDFWNIILGNAEAKDELLNGNDDALNQSLAYTSEEVKNEKANLGLLQLALLGQSPDGDIDKQLAELRAERLDNRVNQLTKIIEHLTSGLPAIAEQNGSIETLVANLEERLENLETKLEVFRDGVDVEDGSFSLLIATGLNPNQLTKITSRIQEVEEKLGRELTVEDLIAGVGNIIPVPGTGDEDNKISTGDFIDLINNTASDEDKALLASYLSDAKKSELEGSIKTTTASAEQVVTDQNTSENVLEFGANIAPIETLQKTPKELGLTNEAIKHEGSFEVLPARENGKQNFVGENRLMALGNRLMARINNLTAESVNTPTPVIDSADVATDTEADLIAPEEQRKNSEFNALFGKTMDKINQQGLQVAKSVLAALAQVGPAPKGADNAQPFLLTADWALPTSEELSSYNFDIHTATPLSHVSHAVHASTAMPQAGQAHPASQMVAVTMHKAAQSGQANEITIQLNPAELGKVKIKLEFGADNAVKAHLVVEKPETLLMLQRDTSSLERALQNAGLETDGISLSFEMAQDGNSFSNDRDNDKNYNGKAGDDSSEDQMEEDGMVIATTMTWDVDPETGHVHYNILA